MIQSIEISGLGIIVIAVIIIGGLTIIFETSEYDDRDMVNAYKEGIVMGYGQPATFNVDSAIAVFNENLKDE